MMYSLKQIKTALLGGFYFWSMFVRGYNDNFILFCGIFLDNRAFAVIIGSLST